MTTCSRVDILWRNKNATCVEEKTMTKTIFTLAVALFSSSLFATERIYIHTSYGVTDEISSLRNMVCRDSQCATHSQFGEGSITLSKAQREQILEAFQTEANRFDMKSSPKPGDQLLTIKLKYTSDRKRLVLRRDLPVNRATDVSPELTAVIKTFLGLDLANLKLPEPSTGEKKLEAATPKEN